MRILRAIGAAMAAMAMFVLAWVEALGRFVWKCMPGYRPADPAMIMQAYEEADQAEASAPSEPSSDRRLEHIQTVAEDLFRQRAPDAEAAAALSDRSLRWITTLDPGMLISVARAKPELLADHLAGRRSLRGVLAYDDASVEEYRRAVQREALQYEPAPEPALRTRRRQEPLLPAFGPMC